MRFHLVVDLPAHPAPPGFEGFFVSTPSFDEREGCLPDSSLFLPDGALASPLQGKRALEEVQGVSESQRSTGEADTSSRRAHVSGNGECPCSPLPSFLDLKKPLPFPVFFSFDAVPHLLQSRCLRAASASSFHSAASVSQNIARQPSVGRPELKAVDGVYPRSTSGGSPVTSPTSSVSSCSSVPSSLSPSCVSGFLRAFEGDTGEDSDLLLPPCFVAAEATQAADQPPRASPVVCVLGVPSTCLLSAFLGSLETYFSSIASVHIVSSARFPHASASSPPFSSLNLSLPSRPTLCSHDRAAGSGLRPCGKRGGGRRADPKLANEDEEKREERRGTESYFGGIYLLRGIADDGVFEPGKRERRQAEQEKPHQRETRQMEEGIERVAGERAEAQVEAEGNRPERQGKREWRRWCCVTPIIGCGLESQPRQGAPEARTEANRSREKKEAKGGASEEDEARMQVRVEAGQAGEEIPMRKHEAGESKASCWAKRAETSSHQDASEATLSSTSSPDFETCEGELAGFYSAVLVFKHSSEATRFSTSFHGLSFSRGLLPCAPERPRSSSLASLSPSSSPSAASGAPSGATCAWPAPLASASSPVTVTAEGTRKRIGSRTNYPEQMKKREEKDGQEERQDVGASRTGVETGETKTRTSRRDSRGAFFGAGGSNPRPESDAGQETSCRQEQVSSQVRALSSSSLSSSSSGVRCSSPSPVGGREAGRISVWSSARCYVLPLSSLRYRCVLQHPGQDIEQGAGDGATVWAPERDRAEAERAHHSVGPHTEAREPEGLVPTRGCDEDFLPIRGHPPSLSGCRPSPAPSSSPSLLPSVSPSLSTSASVPRLVGWEIPLCPACLERVDETATGIFTQPAGWQVRDALASLSAVAEVYRRCRRREVRGVSRAGESRAADGGPSLFSEQPQVRAQGARERTRKGTCPGDTRLDGPRTAARPQDALSPPPGDREGATDESLEACLSRFLPLGAAQTAAIATCRVCFSLLLAHFEAALSMASEERKETGSLQEEGDAQAQGVPGLFRCGSCSEEKDLWLCLVCGHCGCGRYRSGHAKAHSAGTRHRFCLHLASGRIWDYRGDVFVHRLLLPLASSSLPSLVLAPLPAAQILTPEVSPDEDELLAGAASTYAPLLSSVSHFPFSPPSSLPGLPPYSLCPFSSPRALLHSLARPRGVVSAGLTGPQPGRRDPASLLGGSSLSDHCLAPVLPAASFPSSHASSLSSYISSSPHASSSLLSNVCSLRCGLADGEETQEVKATEALGPRGDCFSVGARQRGTRSHAETVGKDPREDMGTEDWLSGLHTDRRLSSSGAASLSFSPSGEAEQVPSAFSDDASELVGPEGQRESLSFPLSSPSAFPPGLFFPRSLLSEAADGSLRSSPSSALFCAGAERMQPLLSPPFASQVLPGTCRDGAGGLRAVCTRREGESGFDMSAKTQEEGNSGRGEETHIPSHTGDLRGWEKNRVAGNARRSPLAGDSPGGPSGLGPAAGTVPTPGDAQQGLASDGVDLWSQVLPCLHPRGHEGEGDFTSHFSRTLRKTGNEAARPRAEDAGRQFSVEEVSPNIDRREGGQRDDNQFAALLEKERAAYTSYYSHGSSYPSSLASLPGETRKPLSGSSLPYASTSSPSIWQAASSPQPLRRCTGSGVFSLVGHSLGEAPRPSWSERRSTESVAAGSLSVSPASASLPFPSPPGSPRLPDVSAPRSSAFSSLLQQAEQPHPGLGSATGVSPTLPAVSSGSGSERSHLLSEAMETVAPRGPVSPFPSYCPLPCQSLPQSHLPASLRSWYLRALVPPPLSWRKRGSFNLLYPASGKGGTAFLSKSEQRGEREEEGEGQREEEREGEREEERVGEREEERVGEREEREEWRCPFVPVCPSFSRDFERGENCREEEESRSSEPGDGEEEQRALAGLCDAGKGPFLPPLFRVDMREGRETGETQNRFFGAHDVQFFGQSMPGRCDGESARGVKDDRASISAVLPETFWPRSPRLPAAQERELRTPEESAEARGNRQGPLLVERRQGSGDSVFRDLYGVSREGPLERSVGRVTERDQKEAEGAGLTFPQYNPFTCLPRGLFGGDEGGILIVPSHSGSQEATGEEQEGDEDGCLSLGTHGAPAVPRASSLFLFPLTASPPLPSLTSTGGRREEPAENNRQETRIHATDTRQAVAGVSTGNARGGRDLEAAGAGGPCLGVLLLQEREQASWKEQLNSVLSSQLAYQREIFEFRIRNDENAFIGEIEMATATTESLNEQSVSLQVQLADLACRRRDVLKRIKAVQQRVRHLRDQNHFLRQLVDSMRRRGGTKSALPRPTSSHRMSSTAASPSSSSSSSSSLCSSSSSSLPSSPSVKPPRSLPTSAAPRLPEASPRLCAPEHPLEPNGPARPVAVQATRVALESGSPGSAASFVDAHELLAGDSGTRLAGPPPSSEGPDPTVSSSSVCGAAETFDPKAEAVDSGGVPCSQEPTRELVSPQSAGCWILEEPDSVRKTGEELEATEKILKEKKSKKTAERRKSHLSKKAKKKELLNSEQTQQHGPQSSREEGLADADKRKEKRTLSSSSLPCLQSVEGKRNTDKGDEAKLAMLDATVNALQAELSRMYDALSRAGCQS
uniref:Zn-finger in ubiquitin-hydrolases domain-containing protein n=1 Tax=Toxoplasma gondii TgCATBr9 TaxID=943120 RepID=A0A2T6IHI8_TOXGO|nr:Zn-finger in ubiquitin-hydrolases domain-containing protein [Toxoplasma gondii TgCATBr9]